MMLPGFVGGLMRPPRYVAGGEAAINSHCCSLSPLVGAASGPTETRGTWTWTLFRLCLKVGNTA
jgi:hypothetical protein